MIKEAIILAGGFGTRLQEVIKDVPKPLAPVNDKPFLDYSLKHLAHYGIKRVVLSVGYLADKVTAHYGNNFQGMEIVYSVEQEPLGTGGGIRLAMRQCHDYNILVLNGDSFFDIDLVSFYNKHSEAVSDASLALRKVDDASRYGTISLGEFDKISSFKEKSTQPKPGTINAGIYMLDSDSYMDETPVNKSFSIEKDFFEKKLNTLNIYGFTYPGYFIDIGIPEDYKQAQHDFKTFKY
jgi:D-glycero-alpha-D-manno-heptose 1-phosphate guanylyltransferase